MPDNFLKITIKWLVALLALNYLTNYLFLFLMQSNGIGTLSPYRNSWFSIVIPLISLFGYLFILGLGIRDLSRSNQHHISVGSVFGFFAIMITVPILVNYGMMYYRSLSDENLAALFENRSFSFSILFGILNNVLQGIIILIYASLWRIFKKAGEKGWHALIPIYNLVIMCHIIKKEPSLVFLFFIPIMNFIALATITNGMAKVFGRSTGFSVGLFFLPFIFFPILAFGENEYIYGEYKVVKDDLDLEDHLVE